jgi:hypothetical protein
MLKHLYCFIMRGVWINQPPHGPIVGETNVSIHMRSDDGIEVSREQT